MKKWYVYILRCRDHSLYAGVTIDVQRRLHEHNHNNRLAARYTRARRPLQLMFIREFDSRAQACRFESQIKAMTRPQKEQLIKQQDVMHALS